MPLNQLLITGTLVEKPELRFLPKGTALCKFTLENRSKRGQNEDVFTGKFSCFGPTAQAVAEMAPGTHLLVSGKLTTVNYKKDGQDKSFTEIVAMTVVGIMTGPVKAVAKVEKAAPSAVEEDDSGVPF